MIVDAHAHIFAAARGLIGRGPTRGLAYGMVQVGDHERERVLPPTARTTTFPPEMLLEHMDWAGVDRAVLLQGSFYGEANDYVWEAVRRRPDRFVGAAFLDPCAADARESFRHLVGDRGFRVIKFELSERTGLTGLHPHLRVDGPEMAWIWDEAERRGLVITLDLGAVGGVSYQTGAVAEMVRRHPGVKVVIAHLAQPPIASGGDERIDRLWQEQVCLAKQGNVWLDLAALPAYVPGEEYPFPSIAPYIRRAAELVGADRLMWGTDAPGLLVRATYPQLLTCIKQHCATFSAAERAGIFGLTAARVYGTA